MRMHSNYDFFMTLTENTLCHKENENPFHNGLLRETVIPLDGANMNSKTGVVDTILSWYS